MGKETKKQHYVPRCYLKRFSRDGRSINTYDKKLSKTYQASMMAVCYEDSLYTLSDKFVERNNAASDATKVNRLTIGHDYFSKDIEPNLDILLMRTILVNLDKRRRHKFADGLGESMPSLV